MPSARRSDQREVVIDRPCPELAARLTELVRQAKLLLVGHPDKNGQPLVRLDRESFQRIADWLDVNAVCDGDFSWNKPEWRPPSPDDEPALRDHIRRRFGPQLAA